MPDAGTDDIQWLASLSDAQVSAHLGGGLSLRFDDIPPCSSVGIDLRTYSTGLSKVLGVPPEPAVHVVSLLSGGSHDCGPPDSACVSACLSGPVGSTIYVRFNDEETTFDIRVQPPKPHDSIFDGAGKGDGEGVKEWGSACPVGERGVAVYTRPHADSWTSVAGHIDFSTLQRAGNVKMNQALFISEENCSSEIKSGCLMALTGSKRSDAGSANRSSPRQPGLSGGSVLSFTGLPKMRRFEGMTPPEITQFNMDRSAYICWVVATRYDGRVAGLLGEFQLAFLVFLLMRNVCGLEHWSKFLREICAACDGLITDAPELVTAFLRTLAAQLEYIEEEVLAAESDSLRVTVLGLCDIACETSDLREGVGSLADVVRRRFGWEATVVCEPTS